MYSNSENPLVFTNQRQKPLFSWPGEESDWLQKAKFALSLRMFFLTQASIMIVVEKQKQKKKQ